MGTPLGAGIAVSSDGGVTWETAYPGGLRIHGFLKIGNRLFALDLFGNELGTATVFEYMPGGEWEESTAFTGSDLFPGVSLDGRIGRIVRAESLGDASVYLAGFAHNDHQFLPMGLFIGEGGDQTPLTMSRVEFGEGWQAWDLFVRDEDTYILLNRLNSSNSWSTSVLKASGLSSCEELISFEGSTFIRSFEVTGSTLYLAWGDELPVEGGELRTLSARTGQFGKIELQEPL